MKLSRVLFILIFFYSCEGPIGTSNESKLSGSSGSVVVPEVFSPTDIASVEVWLDASDPSTIFQESDCSVSAVSAMDKVGCLQDKSGNNNHASAAGSDRPSYLANAIQFSGNADPSNIGNCFDLSSFSAQTVFVVVDNITSNVDGFHGLLGHSTNDDYLFLSSSKGYTVSFDGTGTDRGRFSINDGEISAFGENVGANDLDSSFQLLHLEFEDSHTGWENIGCFNHSSGPKTYRSNFDLNEIVIFSRQLSSDEVEEVKNYLNTKWSIY